MIAIKFISCSSHVNRPHLLILFIFTTSLNHTGSKLATAHLQCLHCPQRQYFQHEAQQQPLWKYLLSPPLKIPLCSWTPPFCDNQICHQDLGLWWILVSSTMRRGKKRKIFTWRAWWKSWCNVFAIILHKQAMLFLLQYFRFSWMYILFNQKYNMQVIGNWTPCIHETCESTWLY